MQSKELIKSYWSSAQTYQVPVNYCVVIYKFWVSESNVPFSIKN